MTISSNQDNRKARRLHMFHFLKFLLKITSVQLLEEKKC